MVNQFFSRLVERILGRSRSGAHTTHTTHTAHTHGGVMSGSMSMPMLDCDSVMRQLWDYLDGELTPERTAAIRAHLELCKRCYPQYEFERSFLEAVAGTARQHSDPDRLRSKLLHALQARGLGEV